MIETECRPGPRLFWKLPIDEVNPHSESFSELRQLWRDMGTSSRWWWFWTYHRRLREIRQTGETDDQLISLFTEQIDLASQLANADQSERPKGVRFVEAD